MRVLFLNISGTDLRVISKLDVSDNEQNGFIAWDDPLQIEQALKSRTISRFEPIAGDALSKSKFLKEYFLPQKIIDR